MLGYSSYDEEKLRNYTNLGVQDTIRAFQQYLHNHIDNQVSLFAIRFARRPSHAVFTATQTSCMLHAYNITDENVIITVKLPNSSALNPVELFSKKKVRSK